jgi:hypothetical protein
MKYYKTEHYKSKNNDFNIYINWYTTKSGLLKFNIEVYAEQKHNNNGFCSCIARFNTSDNNLLKYIKSSDNYIKI